MSIFADYPFNEIIPKRWHPMAIEIYAVKLKLSFMLQSLVSCSWTPDRVQTFWISKRSRPGPNVLDPTGGPKRKNEIYSVKLKWSFMLQSLVSCAWTPDRVQTFWTQPAVQTRSKRFGLDRKKATSNFNFDMSIWGEANAFIQPNKYK